MRLLYIVFVFVMSAILNLTSLLLKSYEGRKDKFKVSFELLNF